MKKLISLLFACALFACILVISASADYAELSISGLYVDGDTATASVSIEGNTGFSASVLYFYYDNSALELTDIRVDNYLMSGAVTNIYSDAAENNTYGILAYAGVENVTADGVLCQLVFHVLDESALSDTVVSVDVSQLVSTDGVSVVGDEMVYSEPAGTSDNSGVTGGNTTTNTNTNTSTNTQTAGAVNAGETGAAADGNGGESQEGAAETTDGENTEENKEENNVLDEEAAAAADESEEETTAEEQSEEALTETGEAEANLTDESQINGEEEQTVNAGVNTRRIVLIALAVVCIAGIAVIVVVLKKR